MVKEKLLLFGGKPSNYLEEWEITSDLPLAEEKLDLVFEDVSIKELLKTFRNLEGEKLTEAKLLTENLLDGSTSVSSSIYKEDVYRAVKLYLSIKDILSNYGGEGLSIVCKGFREKFSIAPCISLTFFLEQCIPAACQGDIDALLTMVIYRFLDGLPVFMGGAERFGEKLGITHCALPRNLVGVDSEVKPYYIGDYHGRIDTPTIGVEIPEGVELTIARLGKGLNELIATKGVLTGCRDFKGKCRNTLLIEVENIEKILNIFKGVQNHFVVSAGDYIDGFRTICREKNIDLFLI